MSKTEKKAVSKALKAVIEVLKNKSESFKNSLVEKLLDEDYVVPDGYCGIHNLKTREELTQKLRKKFII